MELLELVKIIRKNILLIVVMGIVAAVSGVVFYRLRPLTYDVFCAITVSQDREDETTEYKYDNYYSQQAIDTFTDSLEKWFGDAQMISEAYAKAGINIADKSIRQRSKLIKARKLGPQYLELRFQSSSKEDAQKISKSVISVLSQRIEDLRGDRNVWFKVNARDPLIIENRWNLGIVALVTFCSGLLAGVFVSLIRFYLEGQQK